MATAALTPQCDFRGERDGIFTVLRTRERELICSFPNEPLKLERWVFFVRTADAERLAEVLPRAVRGWTAPWQARRIDRQCSSMLRRENS